MDRNHTKFLLLVGALALGSPGCDSPPIPDETVNPDTDVLIRGLTLEVFPQEGASFEVRAHSARLTDLPGRGSGTLEGVEIRCGTELRASAPRAELGADGSILLQDATAEVRNRGVDLRAEQIQLDPSGRLRARGVKARLAIQP
jgi:hypothetical protein